MWCLQPAGIIKDDGEMMWIKREKVYGSYMINFNYHENGVQVPVNLCHSLAASSKLYQPTMSYLSRHTTSMLSHGKSIRGRLVVSFGYLHISVGLAVSLVRLSSRSSTSNWFHVSLSWLSKGYLLVSHDFFPSQVVLDSLILRPLIPNQCDVEAIHCDLTKGWTLKNNRHRGLFR